MAGREEPHAIVLVVGGPISRANLPGLCARARALLEDGGADVVVCHMDPLVSPDAVAVDALARLALIARRAGRRVRIRHACHELRELLTLTGLHDVVPLSD